MSGFEPVGRTALVLSGGGARGAYQVGVLSGLSELGLLGKGGAGFDILVGSSAGAISAAALAAFADDPTAGVTALEQAWCGVEASQVFRTDVLSLGGIGVRWARDLSLGGLMGGVSPKSLLDTSPLRETLASWIPFDRIAAQIESGAVNALALTATDLYTSRGVVFVEGAPGQMLWNQRRSRAEHAKIQVEHVMASSAIPILFPPVQVGPRYFGDGSIRNTAPLSPAIQLGADRILAVGVREPHKLAEFHPPQYDDAPSIAEIAGVLLDAVMLDAIEIDADHAERVNESVDRSSQVLPGYPFRRVDVLRISPSQDISAITAEHKDRVPRVVRYLMRGLGTDDAITELTSYLLFDSMFCSRLVELGRKDVAAQAPKIREFFAREPTAAAS